MTPDLILCPGCRVAFEPDEAIETSRPDRGRCPDCGAAVILPGDPLPSGDIPFEVLFVAALHGMAAVVAWGVAAYMGAEGADPRYVAVAAGVGFIPVGLTAGILLGYRAAAVLNVVWAVLAVTAGGLLFLLGIPFLLCWLVGLIPMAVGALVVLYGVGVAVLSGRDGFEGWCGS